MWTINVINNKMVENNKKLDFVKRIFGFKQCACLDKKVPKIRTDKKVEDAKKSTEEKISCCDTKSN